MRGTVIDQVITFTTVFLGILIEAIPFLLLGTLASGLVEEFISREDMLRLIPGRPGRAVLIGGLLGLAFPVCECGVVPLTRRLLNKGLPASAGIAFLLSAPIINPVVVASTYAAYGWRPILFARFGLGFLIAAGIGLVFSLHPQPARLMRQHAPMTPVAASDEVIPLRPIMPVRDRLQRALQVAADEFFEMARYLIIGSALAAMLQTLVPQAVLLSVGSGPVGSVLVMQGLAFLLSVCSTVDAFLSLAFAGTFTTGSILSFLVFGPMIDIKSTLMFLGVFERRIVVYLMVLPFLLTLLTGVFINLNVPW